MAVPPALAVHVLAAHRVEARVEVLEEPWPNVVDPRPAGGSRRSLVEHPFRRVRAPAHRFAEHVLLPPAGQHRLLERDEVERRINRAEPGGNDTGGPLVNRAVERLACAECGGTHSGCARWSAPRWWSRREPSARCSSRIPRLPRAPTTTRSTPSEARRSRARRAASRSRVRLSRWLL